MTLIKNKKKKYKKNWNPVFLLLTFLESESIFRTLFLFFQIRNWPHFFFQIRSRLKHHLSCPNIWDDTDFMPVLTRLRKLCNTYMLKHCIFVVVVFYIMGMEKKNESFLDSLLLGCTCTCEMPHVWPIVMYSEILKIAAHLLMKCWDRLIFHFSVDVELLTWINCMNNNRLFINSQNIITQNIYFIWYRIQNI